MMCTTAWSVLPGILAVELGCVRILAHKDKRVLPQDLFGLHFANPLALVPAWTRTQRCRMWPGRLAAALLRLAR